jgi:hypothetical protein
MSGQGRNLGVFVTGDSNAAVSKEKPKFTGFLRLQ